MRAVRRNMAAMVVATGLSGATPVELASIVRRDPQLARLAPAFVARQREAARPAAKARWSAGAERRLRDSLMRHVSGAPAATASPPPAEHAAPR